MRYEVRPPGGSWHPISERLLGTVINLPLNWEVLATRDDDAQSILPLAEVARGVPFFNPSWESFALSMMFGAVPDYTNARKALREAQVKS